MQSVVVHKLAKGKKRSPVVLLVAALYPDVLFQNLVDVLSLSVGRRMIASGEVKTHSKCFAQGTEEVINKLGALVAGNMVGDSVLGEDVKDE
jgi:hypothetical protein